MQRINPQEINSWINEIKKIPSGKCSCPSFLKPIHLVTVGLSIKRSKWKNLSLPKELEKYAARMHLWESVGMSSPCMVTHRSQKGRFLPVQRFDKDKRDVQHVAEELASIVIKTASKEYQDALNNCLEELVNNFFDHANANIELPCLVSAQSWPKGKLIQIAVADAGIGIRKSLSENKELASQLSQGNSCEIASQYGITSKPNNEHAGYGLTLAKDLMKQSDGTFVLISGNELFSYSNGKEISKKLDSKWDGTLLVLEWRIDTLLDSKVVYDNWPIQKGFNPDDFL